MPSSSLSPLQWRILTVLAKLEPPFTLTGGGALAGFHLGHRSTRDLDLFWRERAELGEMIAEVRQLLGSHGLQVTTLETGTTFARLRGADADGNACVIDLVADPGAALVPPEERSLGQLVLRVDPKRQILANKLCALLGRSELRDLLDTQALIESGEDLDQGLVDAARQDGGFSPLTLAWVLRSFPLRALALAGGSTAEQIEALERFKRDLLDRLLAAGDPSNPAAGTA